MENNAAVTDKKKKKKRQANKQTNDSELFFLRGWGKEHFTTIYVESVSILSSLITQHP